MKFLTHLDNYFGNRFRIASKLWALFKLEAKLAGLNVLPCVIGIVVLIPLILTLWLMIMLLIGYLIYLLTANILTAIIILLVINCLFIGLVLNNVKRYLRQMSFARTRSCLTHESSQKKAVKTD